MRQDARNLLDRLGASELAYHEFPDRYVDFEPWPLFARMLANPEIRARIETLYLIAPPGSHDARAIQQHLLALVEAGEL